MREGTNVEASCFVDTSSKIVSTAVSEVGSIASPSILTTFANEFSSGETEAIRVVNTSFIVAQLKRFEELFPNVVPVTDACYVTDATLPCITTPLAVSSVGHIHRISSSFDTLVTSITPSIVQAALKTGVRRYIVSTAAEVETLHKICVEISSPEGICLSDIEILLRLKTNTFPFGAEMCQVTSLLQCVARLSLPVLGVSFHCDAGCCDVSVLRMAADAIQLFSASGIPMKHMYISGGISSRVAEQWNVEMTHLLQELNEDGVTIAMEAGRFILEGCASFFLQLYDVREMELEEEDEGEESVLLWLVNEGVLGCFEDIVRNDKKFEPQLVTSLPSSSPVEESFTTRHVLVGCDGGAMTVLHPHLPFTPSIGAWIRIDNMGCAREEGVVVTRYVNVS